MLRMIATSERAASLRPPVPCLAPAPESSPGPGVAVLLNANAKQVNARVRRALSLVVPHEHVFDFSKPQHDWAIYRSAALIFMNHGAHALGVARAGLEAATEIVREGGLGDDLDGICHYAFKDQNEIATLIHK